MSVPLATFAAGISDSPLCAAFLKWQCRVRQIAMRETSGRPDDPIMPAVYLENEAEPLGHIITVLNKAPAYSQVPELLHIAARTQDPAQRRDQAIQYLSATYYQKHREFSDLLTATFPPDSPGAARIRAAGQCRLLFEAYAQVFDLRCRVWRLAPHNAAHKATMAHNRLFNPNLAETTTVLGFEPDWAASSSVPEYR